MPAICGAPVKARVMRLIKLDQCGIPVTGTGSAVVVSKGFIKVDMSSEYEDGDEYTVKNANGDLCVNDKAPSSLKRVTLAIDFCQVDPDSVVLITGERLITTAVGATGTGVAVGEGQLTARWSLELWQPVSGVGACAGGAEQFLYWAYGNVGNAQIADMTAENGPLTFSVQGETKIASSAWGNGPGSGSTWIPSGQGFNGTTDHYIFNMTTTVPPTIPDICGATQLS